jgi:transposase
VYPQPLKNSETTAHSLRSFAHSLRSFVLDYGIPNHLIVDNAPEFIGKKTPFYKLASHYCISFHTTEPYTPRQNPAEGVIREIRRKWFRLKQQKRVPDHLWDYALPWLCEVASLTVNSSIYSKQRAPLQFITGETPGIFECLDFCFYDWICFHESHGISEIFLGRFLGISCSVGGRMTFLVLATFYYKPWNRSPSVMPLIPIYKPILVILPIS